MPLVIRARYARQARRDGAGMAKRTITAGGEIAYRLMDTAFRIGIAPDVAYATD